MRVPKKLIIIGSALTIWYRPNRFRRDSQLDFFTDRHALAVNSTNTTIFALPISGSKARNDATRFKIPYEPTRFKIPSSSLKPIGNAVQIMWRWEEIDQTLLHKWENEKPRIFGDRQTNPRVIAIKYTRGIIFNEEGIV